MHVSRQSITDGASRKMTDPFSFKIIDNKIGKNRCMGHWVDTTIH